MGFLCLVLSCLALSCFALPCLALALLLFCFFVSFFFCVLCILCLLLVSFLHGMIYMHSGEMVDRRSANPVNPFLQCVCMMCSMIGTPTDMYPK